MRGRAWLAELKEKERIAFGPPLTCREQALLIGLSTLYPPQKTDCDPEFLADRSASRQWTPMTMRYPLEDQRAKAPRLADAGPSSSAEFGSFRSGGSRRGVDVFGKVAGPRRDC